VIDLHCHVLPALDDGPGTMPEAIAMAAAASAAGTSTMVATPHIDHHWRVRPEAIPQRAAALQAALHDEGIALQILIGGEIALSRLVDLSAEQLRGVRLGDGPYLLIESPLDNAAGDFDALLLRIRARGESIVLAHPERSPLFQQQPERLASLVEEGLLCSVTTGSLRGDFGRLVRRFTIEMLRDGLVHNVASDSHDHLYRPPGLREALEDLEDELPGIAGQSEWLTRLAPAAILVGERLPPRPALGALIE
jgi:protein-tyrosine phosphatase